MSVVADRWTAHWLPRGLHPAAWWLWALGLAVASTRTTNPLLLALVLAVVGYVVVSRRSDAPWALAFRLYLLLGAFVVVMRVLYRIVFGGGDGVTVLFTLPQIALPPWAAGIRLFGPVSAESLLGGFYDGLQLATLIICVGAANALANPKRLLKSVPSALYEIGSAVVVAVTVFPQLAESVLRVRRARRLRGGATGGRRAVRSIVVPVLADALDRSLLLAASMDSRGYGRHGTVSRRSLRTTSALMLAGVMGVAVGVYGLLSGGDAGYLGWPMLAGGVAVAALGFLLAGRRVSRTSYRPDRWQLAETVTVTCGVVSAASLFLTIRVDPVVLSPPVSALGWPELSLVPVAGLLVALLPAWLTPAPPSSVPRLPVVGRPSETDLPAPDRPPADQPPSAARVTS